MAQNPDMVTAFPCVVQVGGSLDGGLTWRVFMVGEDTSVIVGVVVSMEELLGYHAASRAGEHRGCGEGEKFAATFRSLGGEGLTPRTNADVFWQYIDTWASAGLLDNLLCRGRGDREDEGDRRSGEFV
jgi:hypothetical protein